MGRWGQESYTFGEVLDLHVYIVFWVILSIPPPHFVGHSLQHTLLSLLGTNWFLCHCRPTAVQGVYNILLDCCNISQNSECSLSGYSVYFRHTHAYVIGRAHFETFALRKL